MKENDKKLLDILPKQEIPIYEKGEEGLIKSLMPTDTKEGVKTKDIINFYLLQIIAELRDKTKNGKIKNPETDKLRIKYYGLLINSIETFGKFNLNNSTEDLKTIEDYFNLIEDMRDKKRATTIHRFNNKKNEVK